MIPILSLAKFAPRKSANGKCGDSRRPRLSGRAQLDWVCSNHQTASLFAPGPARRQP
jgi:hypothetical protein